MFNVAFDHTSVNLNNTFPQSSAVPNDAYQTSYSYDLNGNITHLKRNQTSNSNGVLDMDNLVYEYSTDSEGFILNNQLQSVSDNVNVSFNDNDIDGVHEYSYDEIGQLESDLAEGIIDISWTVTGKVKRLFRASGLDDIEFEYDPLGNRQAKILIPKDGLTPKNETFWTKTYYIRDAAGNPLTHYTSTMPNLSTTHLTQTSVDIYGAERLGAASLAREVSAGVSNITFVGVPVYDSSVIDQRIASANYALSQLPEEPAVHERWLGYKQYELSNHLSNVTATISDAKSTHYDGAVHYTPRITSLTDYYPFGAGMPGRGFSAGNYRYGFNGMEGDDEVAGEGNSYTTLFRQYDSRIGRWLSLDPKAAKYPEISPYVSFLNNPIYFTDPQGDDPPEKTKTHKIENGQTLSGIAKQYGTSVDNLVAWNDNISDPDKIYAGSEIKVSDPNRWVGVSNGVWSDTENPYESWTKQDGEWVNLNAQTFGNWFDETWNHPVGFVSGDGEMTIGIFSEAAEAMMQIVPPMVSWGAMIYANPRLPKTFSSSGFQYLGGWHKGGNFGRFGSYNGTHFSFNTSHSFYKAHKSGNLSNTKLIVSQVESAIARNAFQNLNKIPQASPKILPYEGAVNVGGTNVGFRAVMNKGTVNISTYFPK